MTDGRRAAADIAPACGSQFPTILRRMSKKSPAHWLSLLGEHSFERGVLTFKGGTTKNELGTAQPYIGNLLTEQIFAGGTISATITFSETVEMSGCQFVIAHDPASGAFAIAGIDPFSLVSVRTFQQNQWTVHSSIGQHAQLRPGRPYNLEVRVLGSRVEVSLDGVGLLSVDLPYTLPQSHIGLWCAGLHDIQVKGFTVSNQDPTAFVVMQFSAPYDTLYSEVIKPVCGKHGLDVHRADEFLGPGMIINDIEREIARAMLIIADVSPSNPNVFYEVGFARALRKPIILLAESTTKLPFDVSGFRTLFYENSIGGKKRVEDGLTLHLDAVLRTGRSA